MRRIVAAVIVLAAGLVLAAYRPAGTEMVWASIPFALAPLVTIPAMMVNPKQGGFMLKLMLAIDVVLGVACVVFLATPL